VRSGSLSTKCRSIDCKIECWKTSESLGCWLIWIHWLIFDPIKLSFYVQDAIDGFFGESELGLGILQKKVFNVKYDDIFLSYEYPRNWLRDRFCWDSQGKLALWNTMKVDKMSFWISIDKQRNNYGCLDLPLSCDRRDSRNVKKRK
jgi:hypothetical protein